jgi:glycosyltransferase involved in cell wall biosynthesis
VGCQHDVPLIHQSSFDEIYAIDGNSQDGTAAYLESMGIPVYQQPKPGINAACVFAFEKCTTDALIFFHPKGSVPVDDTLKFHILFEKGYDLIIASRNISGAINEEDNRILRPRKWFVGALAIASAVLFRREGTLVWDVLHGFRGMTVNGFRSIQPSNYGVSIDIEMVSRAYKKRLKRTEFPTVEKSRLSGTTHFKALPTGWKLLKYLIREVYRKD